jgi:hypothetical protein
MLGKAQKKVLKCQQASREIPMKKNDGTGNSRRGGKIKTSLLYNKLKGTDKIEQGNSILKKDR